MEKGREDIAKEVALLARAKSGDVQAFDELVEWHRSWAVRLAYSRTQDLSAAEDAVQEAFIQAYFQLKRCRGENGFAPWFAKIVINASYSWRRKSVNREIPVGLEFEKMHSVKEGMHLELWDAVSRLKPKLRAVVFMYYFYDLSEGEIAARLGCPLGTVKSRLHKSRSTLAEVWRGQGEQRTDRKQGEVFHGG